MQAWNYPYPVRTVAVLDGIEMAYIDEGAGPQTLVMLHGMGSNLKGFRKMVDGLKAHYRCIALDLPGYGKSSQGDLPYSMRFFARAVRSFLTALQLEQVTLVGHSMGGQVAMTLVLEDATRVDQLILLAPAGFETFSEEQKAWFGQIYRPELLENLPLAQIRRNFYLNFAAFPDDAQFMIDDRLLMREHAEAFRHFCQLQVTCIQTMLAEPVFDRLPEIDLPTLVLFGREDALIPNRLLHPFLTPKEVAGLGTIRLPQGELELLSPCGHFPQWERAQEVNEAVLGFLDHPGV